MKIKDYTWSMTGDTIQVAEDLELTNPIFYVKTVNYNCWTFNADIELIFREAGGSFKHSRSYTISLGEIAESLGTESVVGAVSMIFSGASVSVSS